MWASLIRFGTIATLAAALSASHEIHLPYMREQKPAHEALYYVPIVWSVHDDDLLANGDRVFPPTSAMTIDAELCAYSKGCIGAHVSLKYSLEASMMLHSKGRTDDAPTKEGVRVLVGLTDSTGEPITPSFIAIEVTGYHGGATHITAIRLIPSDTISKDFMKSVKTSSMRGGQLRTHLPNQHPNQRINQWTIPRKRRRSSASLNSLPRDFEDSY
ncbi:hypothetical protein N7478_010159 [Penicillium angulare]|uniref:uncharacterized protein n=1 Tax=Penicillium angulare TaxID=116970 RepID=UPI0025424254|nr:uncharacterized protein N7478_010159 [Penicillium angulare]KAJ5267351.1 hypothetical protein N7478_010159 [Penicillium angulare]